MREIIFMLLLVVLTVVQIVMLVKGIKRKSLGLAEFAVDILSIVIAASMLIYYDSLPGYGFMPGLTYLFEVLICMGALVLYGLIMFVTVCSKIIMFERRRKREGKTYANPIILTLAFIFLVGAVALFAYEKIENRNIVRTTGVVTAFEEHDITYYENGTHKDITYECPVITFTVDGQEQEDYVYPSYFEDKKEIGETVEIYFDSTASVHYNITAPENAMPVYLAALAIGCILIVYRFTKCKRKTAEPDGLEEPEQNKAKLEETEKE